MCGPETCGINRRLCQDCKSFGACYIEARGEDRWPASITDYFNAIRKRDLCTNNRKYLWEPREEKIDEKK